MHKYDCTDVYGAAQQWSSVYGSTHDAEEVRGSFAQLVHLRHATCEVLKSLGRAATWQSLITAVQPRTQQNINERKSFKIVHRGLLRTGFLAEFLSKDLRT